MPLISLLFYSFLFKIFCLFIDNFIYAMYLDHTHLTVFPLIPLYFFNVSYSKLPVFSLVLHLLTYSTMLVLLNGLHKLHL